MTWPEVNEAVLQRRVDAPAGGCDRAARASPARGRRQPDHRLPVRGGGAAGTRHPAGDAADPLRLQRPQHGLPGHHLDPDGALPPLRRRRGHEPRPSGLPPHLPGQRARIQRSPVRPRRPARSPSRARPAAARSIIGNWAGTSSLPSSRAAPTPPTMPASGRPRSTCTSPPSSCRWTKSVDEIPAERGGPRWLYPGLQGAKRVHFMNWWSRMNNSGVAGTATLATADKGKAMFEGDSRAPDRGVARVPPDARLAAPRPSGRAAAHAGGAEMPAADAVDRGTRRDLKRPVRHRARRH